MSPRFTVLLVLFGLLCLARQSIASPEVRPVRGLQYTARDILEIRELAKSDPVARIASAEFLRRAAPWVDRDEAEIAKLIPPDDAVFAYGFAGDPVGGAKWDWFGGGGICSLERPGLVRSPADGAIYGGAGPGEPFHDDGRGWKRPSDGKMFYFKGIWNAYVIRRLHDGLDALAIAYMLTGDSRYAERALFLLDRFATMRSRRPAIDGSVDYPVVPAPGMGFFSYNEGHANRRMIASAVAFDLVGRHAAAARPSPTSQGLSVFENIRRHYFSIFEERLTLERASLQGHAAAAFSNKAAQGVLFGRGDYLRDAIGACYALLDTAIDRDGASYETSATYDGAGRRNVAYITTLIHNYDPAGYAVPGELPRREDYPHGLRLGDDPAWFRAAIASQFDLTVLSRRPQFGDAPVDRFTSEGGGRTRAYDPAADSLNTDRVGFLRLFHHQTANPVWRAWCERLYRKLPEGARLSRSGIVNAILLYGASQWRDLPAPADGAPVLPGRLDEAVSVLTGQKRMAVLRSGEGRNQRALLMRGGSVNSHAHADQLALALYADGLSLSGEFGYNLHGGPDHYGYGTRAASHNLVVVDEDLPARPFSPSTAPAEVAAFHPAGTARFVEMDNPGQWPGAGLAEYRRLAWMVDVSPETGYFVDVFRISGGRVHDYLWTTPFVDPPREDAFALRGIEPRPWPGVWSLAALSGREPDASFNRKGGSWGELVNPSDGTIRGGKSGSQRLWNPPPGNGYGFIFDVRGAETRGDWSASWLLHDLKHTFTLGMLNRDSLRVSAAKGPSLTKGRFHDVVIARREAGADGAALASRFVSVLQISPPGGTAPVDLAGCSWLDGYDGPDIGFTLARHDGGRDAFAVMPEGSAPVRNPELGLAGGRAFVRRDAAGRITSVLLHEGMALQAGELWLRTPRAAWTGSVLKVEPQEITLDAELPAGSALAGRLAVFAPAKGAAWSYAAGEPFTIDRVERAGAGLSLLRFDLQSTVAARLLVAERAPGGVIRTVWPNELAAIRDGGSPGVFDGHLLVDSRRPERATRLRSYLDKNRLVVDDAALIEPGRTYDLLAVQPGDRFRIAAFVELELGGDGRWRARANTDFQVCLPGAATPVTVTADRLREGFFPVGP